MLLITQWIVGHHNSHPDRIFDCLCNPTRRTRHQIIAVRPPFKRWRSPAEAAKGHENYQQTIATLKAKGWTITDEENLFSDDYIVWLFSRHFPGYLNEFKLFRAEKETA